LIGLPPGNSIAFDISKVAADKWVCGSPIRKYPGDK